MPCSFLASAHIVRCSSFLEKRPVPTRKSRVYYCKRAKAWKTAREAPTHSRAAGRSPSPLSISAQLNRCLAYLVFTPPLHHRFSTDFVSSSSLHHPHRYCPDLARCLVYYSLPSAPLESCCTLYRIPTRTADSPTTKTLSGSQVQHGAPRPMKRLGCAAKPMRTRETHTVQAMEGWPERLALPPPAALQNSAVLRLIPS